MEGDLPAQLNRIKADGYEGFELAFPHGLEAGQWEDRGLGFVGMAFPQSVDGFKASLDEAHRLGAELLNCHAGKDWWSWEQGCEFFSQCLRVKSDIPVCFETHRGRLLHQPSTTFQYLKEFPGLRLTADFSHWTTVCESLLADQANAVLAAIARTSYLHARLGFEEGPQVNDPRASEWESQREAFFGWWDAIRQAHVDRGETQMRVDPEFGPFPYMPSLPGTREPLVDLNEVCAWMRDTLKSRWACT